jgi:hypothetical protein
MEKLNIPLVLGLTVILCIFGFYILRKGKPTAPPLLFSGGRKKMSSAGIRKK